MKCQNGIERIIEYDDDESPQSLLFRVRFFIHSLTCPNCKNTMEQYEDSRELMRTGFFSEGPDMSDAIMDRVFVEEPIREDREVREWISLRNWIIAGCIILVSLVSSFFGFNFKEVAASRDSSYMLSIGLVIGLIVSIYGLLFIGTQLKQIRHFLEHRE